MSNFSDSEKMYRAVRSQSRSFIKEVESIIKGGKLMNRLFKAISGAAIAFVMSVSVLTFENINEPIKASAATSTRVTNLKAYSNDTSIKLTWDRFSGANGYIIELRNSNGVIIKYPKGYMTPNNYLTFANLKLDTSYIFTVKAVRKTNGTVSVGQVSNTSSIKTLSASNSNIKKSTQKYQLYNAKAGKNVFTNVACTQKNTPGWNQSSSGLCTNIKVTGIKDEIHNCVKVQMNYQNFYIKSSDVSVISSGTSKILPTGAISQIKDVKDYALYGSYKNKYWCGCGPTSIAMLVDWELEKNIARNKVISDAAKLKVAVLGRGYDFYNNNTGSCFGLSPRADGLDTLLKYEAGKNIAWQEVKKSQSGATDQIKNLLQKNHRVIAGVSPTGTWGHYIVIAGYYTKNNVTHFIVADPLYSDKNIRYYYSNNYKNSGYSYYSLCDYTETDLYYILNKARYCSNYTRYNASNIAYLWYLP